MMRQDNRLKYYLRLSSINNIVAINYQLFLWAGCEAAILHFVPLHLQLEKFRFSSIRFITKSETKIRLTDGRSFKRLKHFCVVVVQV